MRSLLTASQTPPLDYLTTTLINEITDLPEEFLLVLDDYHLINHQDIHQFVSTLIRHSLPPVHLVIVTRQDAPFSISRLRASQTITEIRGGDLRFTPEEVQSYLKLCLGADVPPETVTVLAERTEGWAVGLRLACLALRDQDDTTGFLETFQGTHQYIMEYLVDEVLSRQPQPVQTFLLRTSFLDRFCAPLCEEILDERRKTKDEGKATAGTEYSSLVDCHSPRSEDILASLERANLFVVSLDQQGEWFRYHHLFKDLLWHKLKAETTPAQRAALHTAAGTWLDQNDFVEEALRHYFAANDTAAAAYVVARQRYALMNQTQWLRQFSPDTLDQYPDLLMLKTWLVYHQADWLDLPAALQRVEAALDQASLTPEAAGHLRGEISAVRSLLSYVAGDAKNAIACARQSIEKTAPELWGVRILARQCLGAAHQMAGDLEAAYAAVYRGFEEETEENGSKQAIQGHVAGDSLRHPLDCR